MKEALQEAATVHSFKSSQKLKVANMIQKLEACDSVESCVAAFSFFSECYCEQISTDFKETDHWQVLETDLHGKLSLGCKTFVKYI